MLEEICECGHLSGTHYAGRTCDGRDLRGGWCACNRFRPKPTATDTLDLILAELQKLNATLDHYRPIVDRLLRKEN